MIEYNNGLDHQKHEIIQSYTQSHSHKTHRLRNHHNRHQFINKNRENFAFETHMSESTRQLLPNERDLHTSPLMSRVSDSTDKIDWKRKLMPPLNPSSILFKDQYFPKSSRKSNNSTKSMPNIIFILTDDQDIELGQFY